jgi:hypothetical protein
MPAARLTAIPTLQVVRRREHNKAVLQIEVLCGKLLGLEILVGLRR